MGVLFGPLALYFYISLGFLLQIGVKRFFFKILCFFFPFLSSVIFLNLFPRFLSWKRGEEGEEEEEEENVLELPSDLDGLLRSRATRRGVGVPTFPCERFGVQYENCFEYEKVMIFKYIDI